MKKESTSTRRSFLRGGAILAAPIAGASISAAAVADDRLKARAERLESEAAIRELHQSWLRRINAGERDARLDGAVRRVIADHAGAPDRIDVAADGRTAVGHFDHAVEIETPLPEDCTLAQMARAQGNGAACRIERRLLTIDYTRTGGSWAIRTISSTVV